VYVCTIVGEPRARPDEVESVEWWSWEAFVAAAGAGELSPWAQLQAPLLDARRHNWRTR
jgi:isopentenyl-diphosphate delta-isomerase